MTMQDLIKALPHLITAVLVIASATVLAALHIISGGESIAMIGAAGGFTLGVTGASGSISTAARAAVTVSQSGSGPTPITPSQPSPTVVPNQPVN